jgi:hypothetical protein
MTPPGRIAALFAAAIVRASVKRLFANSTLGAAYWPHQLGMDQLGPSQR